MDPSHPTSSISTTAAPFVVVDSAIEIYWKGLLAQPKKVQKGKKLTEGRLLGDESMRGGMPTLSLLNLARDGCRVLVIEVMSRRVQMKELHLA
jgi:hypothetical protein